MINHNTVYTNQTIRIYGRIRDIDGNLSDPSTIAFIYLEPDDDTEGVNQAITKESVGVYYVTINVAKPGKHRYTWETYGTSTTTYKGFFQAEDNRWQ